MTAGSGRRLWRHSNLSGPLGAYSRTLLESRTWGSTEYLLRWKEKATKSGRYLIFRLAPWTPRNSGTASGLWPTAQAFDGENGNSYESWKARQARNPNMSGSSLPTDLPVALKSLYPTPQAREGDDSSRTPTCENGLKRFRQGRRNLDDAAAMLGGLVRTLTDESRHGVITSGPLSLTEKFAVRLALLSAWLMAYPWSYLKHWDRQQRKGKSKP